MDLRLCNVIRHPDVARFWHKTFAPTVHANEVIENSRIETVLPTHGPTDGADSIPE